MIIMQTARGALSARTLITRTGFILEYIRYMLPSRCKYSQSKMRINVDYGGGAPVPRPVPGAPPAPPKLAALYSIRRVEKPRVVSLTFLASWGRSLTQT